MTKPAYERRFVTPAVRRSLPCGAGPNCGKPGELFYTVTTPGQIFEVVGCRAHAENALLLADYPARKLGGVMLVEVLAGLETPS